MNSTYLDNSFSFSKFSNNAITKKIIVSSITIILGALLLISSILSLNIIKVYADEEETESYGVISDFLCRYPEGSIPVLLLELAQTDIIPFSLSSKSVVSFGRENVDSFLNKLMGMDYVKNNEIIIGRPLEFDKYKFDWDKDGELTVPLEFNGGGRMNPFDRFGVSGLYFNIYRGEFKYYEVSVCSNEKPKDLKETVYYQGRLEPKSTYSDINNSKDPRTKQYNSNIFDVWFTSFLMAFANFGLIITKFLVALSVSLIGLAFSDISETLGIYDIIAGDPTTGAGGVFQTLFNNVFQQFIIIIFAMTAFTILWLGIVKKQYRQSMTILIRNLILFVIAIFVSLFPSQVVALPNQVATLGQALIVSSFSGGYNNGGLCHTSIGFQENDQLNLNELGETQSFLESVTDNVKSNIGCVFWENFLLRPWAQGQWGVEWDETWAKGTMPSWSNGEELQNSHANSLMVGDAAVPLGGGDFINNWAIFQISTQTNAHSPIGLDGELSEYTNGTAHDWWRIVDVLSNYSEIERSVDNSFGENISFTEAEGMETLDHWSDWVGNTAWNSIVTANSSIIIALIGLILPIFLAFLGVIYSITLTILMGLTPLMLLIGCWGNKGWDFFKGWGETVLNTIVKKIVIAGLLMFSLILITAGLNLMKDVGWIQGLTVMMISLLVFFQSRDKIVRMFASIKFSSGGFSQTADRLSQGTSKAARGTGRVALGAGVGGLTSKKYGGSFREGAISGAKEELRTQSYAMQGDMARGALDTQRRINAHSGDLGRDFDRSGRVYCPICGKLIHDRANSVREEYIVAAMDRNGNYYCRDCFDDGFAPEDAIETQINTSEMIREQEESLDGTVQAELRKRRNEKRVRSNFVATQNASVFDNEVNKAVFDAIRHSNYSDTEKNEMFKYLCQEFIIEKEKAMITGGSLPIPHELQPYLDKEVMEEAWNSKDYDFIEESYTLALSQWFVNNTDTELSHSNDDIKSFSKDVNDLTRTTDWGEKLTGDSSTNVEGIIIASKIDNTIRHSMKGIVNDEGEPMNISNLTIRDYLETREEDNSYSSEQLDILVQKELQKTGNDSITLVEMLRNVYENMQRK